MIVVRIFLLNTLRLIILIELDSVAYVRMINFIVRTEIY